MACQIQWMTQIDSPDSDWEPYYDEIVNNDLHDELFAADDDSSNFEGS